MRLNERQITNTVNVGWSDEQSPGILSLHYIGPSIISLTIMITTSLYILGSDYLPIVTVIEVQSYVQP